MFPDEAASKNGVIPLMFGKLMSILLDPHSIFKELILPIDTQQIKGVAVLVPVKKKLGLNSGCFKNAMILSSLLLAKALKNNC